MLFDKKKSTSIYLGMLVISLILIVLPLPYNLNNTNNNFELIYLRDSAYLETPITIDGNDAWALLEESEPWCTGNGSSSSPYIIENIIVNGSESIKISQSDVHFIIRNCTLYSPSRSAIVLTYVSNGKILNNEILNNGISLSYDTDYNIISGNTLHHGAIAVSIGSDHNIISNNTINNDQFGILLGGASTVSTNITISDNIINTSTLDDSHRFFE
jgi:hypothetical protein